MSISYLVSIIIPVYNMENTIGMLLEDIEKQSYKNMEIIIVNDGSTDLSHEIISQYVSRDNRFREILTNQGGVSVARNIGISEARGEYIRFLDADDRLPQDSIYMMVQAMSEENVELVLGGFQTVPDKDSLYVNRSKQGCVPLQEMMLDFAYNPQTFYYGVNWNKLYKREIIESNKILFNSKIGWCEDLLFNLQYYSKCKNVYYIPNNIYIYMRNNPQSITKKLKNRKDIEAINEYRYQCAYKLFEWHGLQQKFVYYWDLNKTYSRILDIFSKEQSWHEKQKEFKKIMLDERTIDFFENEQRGDFDRKEYIYILLRRAVVKRKYNLIFVFISVKNSLAKGFPGIRVFWLKYLKGGVKKWTQK